MEINMNRRQIILIAALILLLALLLLGYQLFINRPQTNQTPNIPTNQETGQKYYANPQQNTKFTPFPAINADKKIDETQIAQITGKLDTGYIKMPLYSYEYYESDKKFNPSMTFSATIQTNNLQLYKNPENSLIKSLPLSESVDKANFAWITDDLILLMERTNGQVNFYLINTKSGNKTLLTTDQTIASGVNVDIGPVAYNEASNCLIVLTSNSGESWSLTLFDFHP